jgi:hypothetical protein
MKKAASLLLLCTVLLIAGSCYNSRKVNTEYARSRNICKELKGKVLVYMVFVDTKNNNPWTDFDINTAFKSAGEAADWLMGAAKKNGVQMDIEIKYFQSGKMRTVFRNLPFGTVKKSVSVPTTGAGVYRLNRWADAVAEAVGKKIKFPGEVDNSIIRKPKDNVELISKLRDIYRVENVALIYLLNNTYTNDVSVSLNTVSDKKIEYAIASYKTPQVLAQEILKLFGAAELSENPFSGSDLAPAAAQWPGDIMANTKEPLDRLEVGPLTQYLVGWKDKPDSTFVKYLGR